jgi:ATP-binding cassette subfamily C exporter for protease/lipase
VLTFITERTTQAPLSQANTLAVQANTFAGNSLRNAEVIEAMGMLGALRAHWRRRHEKSLALQRLASNRAGSIGAVTRCTRVSLQSLALGLGAWLVINEQLGAGGMFIASILTGRALSPIEQVIGAWRTLVGARSAYDRLATLLKTFPAATLAMPLPRPLGALSVEAVSAVAPNTQSVILKGISFSVAPAEIVAIIGPSASGKSSLARLLVGVWPAAAGKVRLDGADIHAWNKLELGRHVGYLPQDVELFEGSVADNIARFNTPDPEATVRAAQRAGVHEMILRLPRGYESEIGIGGSHLSGGQRQRIGLARALYGDPALVVLDEPNANLDETGELALIKAMQDLSAAGSTVLIIAHRSGIVAVADKLLVLREGMQQAFGPRADVIAALSRAAQAAARAPLSTSVATQA